MQQKKTPFLVLSAVLLMGLNVVQRPPPDRKVPAPSLHLLSLQSIDLNVAVPERPDRVIIHLKDEVQAAAVEDVTTAVPPPPPPPEPEPEPEPGTTTYTAADAVADCESGDILADGTAVPGSYDIRAHNPTSSASGAWQFIDSTWTSVTGLAPPAAAYSERVQRDAFHELWDGGNGASHWAPSRHCWQHLIP